MQWRTPRLREGAAALLRRNVRLVVVVAAGTLSISGTAAYASSVGPTTPVVHPAVEVTATVAPTSVAPATVPPTTTTVEPATTIPARPAPPAVAPVPRPAAASTTVAPSRPAVPRAALAQALRTRSTVPAAPSISSPATCGAALAYLSAHSAPGFTFECPGYALGHQAMTCINVAGVCAGQKLIVINRVCAASYMNEAHNSWVLSELQSGSIDPYGYCH